MKLALALSVSLTCVAALAQPECSENFQCLDVFEPVCGTNGVTYSNNCLLKKAQCQDSSVTKRADGACTASDKPTTTAPPAATTKAPEDGPAPTTTTPATTTAAPGATPTTSAPSDAATSPSKGSSDGDSDSAGSDSDPQETDPSVATTAPTSTTKAPVPEPTKSNAAPLYAVGASAVAAWVIAALL